MLTVCFFSGLVWIHQSRSPKPTDFELNSSVDLPPQTTRSLERPRVFHSLPFKVRSNTSFHSHFLSLLLPTSSSPALRTYSFSFTFVFLQVLKSRLPLSPPPNESRLQTTDGSRRERSVTSLGRVLGLELVGSWGRDCRRRMRSVCLSRS